MPLVPRPARGSRLPDPWPHRSLQLLLSHGTCHGGGGGDAARDRAGGGTAEADGEDEASGGRRPGGRREGGRREGGRGGALTWGRQVLACAGQALARIGL